MYRSILVPLDGSTFGEHALPVARTIARASGATVHLAQVHVPTVKHTLAREPRREASRDAENRTRERAYLEAIPARLGAEADLKVVPVVLDGPIAQALAAYVATNAIDLVVMTTHGRGGVTRLWLGNVAATLAHHLRVPLLLIRPEETPPELTALRPFHQFLIPLDGSPLAEQILEPTLALGALTGSAYTLVQIIDPLAQPGEVQIEYAAGLDYVVTEELRSAAEQYLSQVAAKVHAQGSTVQTRVVIADHTAAALVDVAEASGADVIALTTHGRGALERLLVGSVTDKVVRSAAMPVLLYRPTDHDVR